MPTSHTATTAPEPAPVTPALANAPAPASAASPASPATPCGPTALIAEDEPLLAAALKAELAHVWPALRVLATVGDGHSAVTQALALRPDVLFFDIRMPGQTGLEAAAELADAWPADGDRPFPALVFVTAYDHYACQAFDVQAVDYVLKPVQRERLKKTAHKVQLALDASGLSASKNQDPPVGMGPGEQQLRQLAALLAQAQTQAPTSPPAAAAGAGAGASAISALGMAAPPAQASSPLSVIQASVSSAQGAALVMVPVAQVLYFEATDKYVRVVTAERELLIRTPLKELLPRLHADHFWQVHRGTVVRVEAIASATRDEAGKLWLELRQRPERLAVSRLYAHLFKAM